MNTPTTSKAPTKQVGEQRKSEKVTPRYAKVDLFDEYGLGRSVCDDENFFSSSPNAYGEHTDFGDRS